MKRIIVGLFAVILAMAGLVTVSSSPASAACPYTNCVATSVSTAGQSNLPRGGQTNISIGVRAVGNVDPVGRISLTVYRVGKKGVVTTKSKRLPATPPADGLVKTVMITPKLTPGSYQIVFRYTPDEGTLFRASRSSRNLLIRK